MAEVQIAGLSNRHVAIADFLVANPSVRKCDVAEHFGVSPAWLSVVIHSDAFQALLREKQAKAYSYLIAPLAEKLGHLAHRAIDKLAEHIEVSNDPGVLLEVSKFSTDRINWDGKPMEQRQAGGLQVNVYQPVVATILREAQARARAGRQGALIEHAAVEAIEQDSYSPAAPRVLAGGTD